jgi:hypothetical protein
MNKVLLYFANFALFNVVSMPSHVKLRIDVFEC